MISPLSPCCGVLRLLERASGVSSRHLAGRHSRVTRSAWCRDPLCAPAAAGRARLKGPRLVAAVGRASRAEGAPHAQSESPPRHQPGAGAAGSPHTACRRRRHRCRLPLALRDSPHPSSSPPTPRLFAGPAAGRPAEFSRRHGDRQRECGAAGEGAAAGGSSVCRPAAPAGPVSAPSRPVLPLAWLILH